jgi:2-dehydropantoate 2-reductase
VPGLPDKLGSVRFVVYGAGAVGGVVGGRLAEAGHEVALIARGRHLDAIRSRGLRIDSPDRSVSLTLPAVAHPSEIEWRGDEVVLMAVKSQDTIGAADRLALVAGPDVAVVSMQNGVANERVLLRRFRRTYGVFVACPATHLEPGVVEAHSSPLAALLDVGRYPSGVDQTADELAAAVNSAGMEAIARPDVMRWKYAKLLMNLGNVVGALCGPDVRGGRLNAALREEAVAVYVAAGIDRASDEEDRERRRGKLVLGEIAGRQRQGDSSWQSLERRTGAIETDYLNGEIVLLGRLHGVPTPANEAVCRRAREVVASGLGPGSVSEQELLNVLAAPA